MTGLKFATPAGLLMLLTMLATPGLALAQTEQEFVDVLTGEWVVHDDVYAVEGNNCRITLNSDKSGDDYTMKLESCGLELGTLTGWRLLDGQLALTVDGNIMGVLGGNQFRMSGNLNIGAPVIMDRAGANQSMAAILKAREDSGCYYLGFTNTCIDEVQLAKPPVPADGSPARIGVLINLNVRAEARDDAGVLGVVPANSCIVTEVCATAADGVWCRATFGENTGWLKKLALRQERWPVVTFVNQCAQQ